jgi:hypothetical protein
MNSAYYICLRTENSRRDAAFSLAAGSMVQLYEKCRYKDDFLAAEPRYVNGFLIAGDADGLAACLQKSPAAQRAADLRLRVRRSIR